jgi:hypothetical protein
MAAERAAHITLLDGAATVLAGAQTWQAATGLRLGEGALVDTAANCTLLRLEWPDGSLLDLGPSTRIMLAPPGSASAPTPAFYLLQGMAKFSGATGALGWRSSRLEAAAAKGVVVLMVDPLQTVLFAESGAQVVTDRGAARSRNLAAGEQLSMVPGKPAESVARPTAALLGRLPRAFRDSLPPRLATLKLRTTPADAAPPQRYAELQPWLTAEPALRQQFPKRLAGRLADPEFRSAITANLRAHPEWAPLLEPPRPAAAKPAPAKVAASKTEYGVVR